MGGKFFSPASGMKCIFIWISNSPHLSIAVSVLSFFEILQWIPPCLCKLERRLIDVYEHVT